MDRTAHGVGQGEIRGHVETIDAEAAAPMSKNRKGRCADSQVFWCLHRHRMMSAVLERDRGICKHCGRDMVAIRAEIDAALVVANGTRAWVVREFSVRFRVSEYAIEHLRLWDCDHVLPMIDGGLTFDLANLQTLCIFCHNVKSNGESQRRRHPGQLSLFPDFEAIVTP